MDEPIILLVEDDTLISLVAHDALEAGGFSVVVARAGSEAFEILDARSGELSGVVTDIRLGGGPNGWVVARHAREARPDVPIVYTTSDGAAEWPVQGVPNSVLVQKPYAPMQLLTAISSLITKADTNSAS